MSHSARTCRHCQKHPNHGYAIWAAIIGGALLLEAEGLTRKRYPHTLSHTARFVFKTHTKVGKAVFVAGWSALTYWFLPHVLKGVNVDQRALEEMARPGLN